MNNINKKTLNTLKLTIVSSHIFFKSDPRGDFQTYYDCVEGLKENVLDEWFDTALADLDLYLLRKLLKEGNCNNIEYDSLSNKWYALSVAQLLCHDALLFINAIGSLIQHKNPHFKLLTKASDAAGRNIVRQAISGTYVVTEYTGNVYQVISLSTDNTLGYEGGFTFTEIQEMFDNKQTSIATRNAA